MNVDTMNVDLKQDNQKSGLGLFFRILMLLATPVAMILLAYLFLIPPETQPEHEVTSIGLVILDPVPMEPLSELDDDNSTLGRWFHQGLAGPLEPLGADTMDDAVIEITTGFNPRKLPLGQVTLNLETYELIERSSINQGSPAVDAILTNAGYTDKLTVIRLSRMDESVQEYLHRVGSEIAPYVKTIHTWIVVSPAIEVAPPDSWDPNQWLESEGYLVRDDSGTIDYSQTRVFHTGTLEPGLRINREVTYSKGIVPRQRYESLRNELAGKLRLVELDDGRNFEKVFPGDKIFKRRQEGHYPDVVWRVSGNGNGWALFHGIPFDHELQDKSRLTGMRGADIAPTILYLLRLPVAKDMDGRVLRPLMQAGQHRRMPETVDTYSTYDPLVEQIY